jgi:hypothetical protein
MHVPRACVVLLTFSLCCTVLRTKLVLAQGRDNSQTMEETQSWLKARLEGKSLLTDGTPAVNKTTSLDFDSCAADWRVEHRQGSERGMSKVRLTLRASQLYWPVKVTSKGRVNQAYAVVFSPIPGSSGIIAKLDGRNDSLRSVLVAESQVDAERIAQAFSRWIELCGGQEEPL